MHNVVDPDPDSDSHPHQMKKQDPIRWIRNRIRIRINLQMTSQNVWNMGLFEHFSKGLSLYLEARIWIRIRIHIRVKSRIRISIRVISRIRIMQSSNIFGVQAAARDPAGAAPVPWPRLRAHCRKTSWQQKYQGKAAAQFSPPLGARRINLQIAMKERRVVDFLHIFCSCCLSGYVIYRYLWSHSPCSPHRLSKPESFSF